MKKTPPLPKPFVDPDVDLRGLEYMPLLGGKLFGSTFDLEATDAEWRVGLRLWWQAWNQVPAASLPSSERSIARLAGFEDETSERWRAVAARALHGFTLCSDGRLYHEVLAYQAAIAWDKRQTSSRKNAGILLRKERERQDRKAMFSALRDLGIVPGWKTSTTRLRELVSAHLHGLPPGVRPGGDPDHVTPPVTPPVTPNVTEKTGRDVIQESAPGEAVSGSTRAQARAPAHAHVAAAVPEEGAQSREIARRAPTPAGEVGLALKQAGLNPMQFNLADPVFRALLEQGATVEEFVGIAKDALDRKVARPFPWILKTLENRRAQAAELELAPAPRGAPPKKSTALEQQSDTLAAFTGGRKAPHHDDPRTIDVDARRVD